MERRPGDANLIISRARDHLRHGRNKEAAADYRRVIRQRPVDEDWLEACEACLLTGGRTTGEGIALPKGSGTSRARRAQACFTRLFS
jgi:hypothetical protein